MTRSMGARLIDGKAVAGRVLDGVRADVAARRARQRREPCLATVIVGDDPASTIYVRNKIAAC
ncbi:MAG TPA: tetrahydrofolate dehydrogenase/cyclohydrolase catalytic domain-containing protein, partial [Nevskiaceae bacterium]|nr:tetrahydrofolate dehydrogenase/cyclohydrolase catalytic domain-containing protein [Nevskiaceae bacterium]